jgi:DNA-binding CsgD family transcriptional regulator
MKQAFISIIFLILSLAPYSLEAQIKGKGLPFIVNHTNSVYNAGTQNWGITQGQTGFMYFANNDGILEFDGTSWRVFPVSNASVVRSVLAVGDRVYAGAFEEIGYLAPDNTGQMQWNSLVSLIPAQYANFDEVWRIFHHNDRIIFQSFSHIFILQDNSIHVIEPAAEFSFMHQVGNSFFLVEQTQGLMTLKNDTLVLVSNHPIFFRNEIMFMLPLSLQRILVGTSNEGIFVMEGGRLTPWQSQVNPHLTMQKLFSGVLLSDGNFAFGSIRNGLYVTDAQGNVLQHLNRFKGLQNNTILSIFQDRRDNLWIGLDNGIDLVEIGSPITIFNHIFNIETVYASIVHNNRIYVGTNQGLFVAPFDAIHNQAGLNPGFTLIEGTEGQVWSLQVIGNTLFCGHNIGCFVIEGNSARQISDIRGFWSFLQNPFNPSQILAGTYTGLVILTKTGGGWIFDGKVEGFQESTRHFFIDHLKNIWVSHGYRGIFKLQPQDDFRKINKVSLMRNQRGLTNELPFNINIINGQMVVTTREGILQYDYTEQVFKPHPVLSQIFSNKGFIDKMHQDSNGNIWYFTDHYLGFMRRIEDGTFRDITSPFSRINEFLLPAFQNLFNKSAENIFIGTQRGLVHYNSTIIHDQKNSEPVFFREVVFYGREGNRKLLPVQGYTASHSGLRFSYALNSVSFRFTTPVYQNPTAIRFAYRLQGFDASWSNWSTTNFKEYTNLREGNYVFEVKAINAFGIESPVSEFPFSIAPPWHRSNMAFAFYALLALIIMVGNLYYIRRRILRVRQREKIRLEKRLTQREKLFREQNILSEKEILHLRNETLRIEMDHKNKELANATLHLIQKNKTLTDLKDDLGRLLRKGHQESQDKQLLNNLLRKITKDLRNEQNWEIFNSYFDEVHQNFISRLKSRYSNLTPKDLRLCAYLRMNISSKEIAPLMNVSVRGVEISRYRLRQKLKLSHDTNLAEFIMTF